MTRNNKADRDIDELTRNKIYCKCGHTVDARKFKKKYVPCNWCGNLVFVNKKEEFKYRLNEAKARKKAR